ncbi:MAG: hypothetical protein ACRETR_03750, partial [Steroidobacteraceae bacterium]
MSQRLLVLPGGPALSGFRIEKLLARIAAVEPLVSDISARFVHFAALARTLSADELQILRRL